MNYDVLFDIVKFANFNTIKSLSQLDSLIHQFIMTESLKNFKNIFSFLNEFFETTLKLETW